MSSNCLFCRIAAQQIPAHVVYQDDSLMAFLDIHPAREGHTLIIPREHHPYFEDIPPALMVRMTLLAQRVARAQKKLFKVERVGMAITGVHVAHAHIHLIPMATPNDILLLPLVEQQDLTVALPPQAESGQLALTATRIGQAVAQDSIEQPGDS
ncbi:MAG: HIT family protein [Burkholderiaceae bacterium]|jgi:histidine triad (HIT) family protein|nr:HIT family protein [Burkholderiaceae bacterium]